jgi:membrane-bound lytic murein transglycosylase A
MVATLRGLGISLAVALALLVGGCESPRFGTPVLPGISAPPPAAGQPSAPDRLVLEPVGFSALPDWGTDRLAEVVPALTRSCQRVLSLPTDRAVGESGIGGVAGDWSGPCGALGRADPKAPGALQAYFESWFEPYRVTAGGRADGLFTGYYEAELKAAKRPGARFRYPIHGKPKDLVFNDAGREVGRWFDGRLIPYYTRREIEAGVAKGQAPELLWAEDPVDLFIMQIQGSGRATLDDGTVVRLGYAAHNGHTFVGIGRILQDRGVIGPSDMSMQAIRTWLRANPQQARNLMWENPRYIFFRIVQGEGPIGAQGVPLTAGRSLAVDPRYVPLGVPLWLDTVEPSGRPLRRMMVAQDTGGAIKGPIRGDFYWGTGEPALEQAGRMRSRGSYYVLLPRQRSNRVASN